MNNLTIDPKQRLDFSRRKSKRKSLYSSTGIRPLVLLAMFLMSISVFGQNVGDYGTIGSGNWTDQSKWGVWNGAAYVNDGTYPGQSSGSYDVYIINGNSITINSDINNSFNSIIIGDDNGLPGSKEEVLALGADRHLETSYITIKKD